MGGNGRYGGPKGRRPTARRWPRWPRCSPEPRGFALPSRLWKVFLAENQPPALTRRRPHGRSTSGWASLTKGKAAVIGELAAEVVRRDPQGHKIHVALTDGERALQILVSQKLKVTLILDLLHALEKTLESRL